MLQRMTAARVAVTLTLPVAALAADAATATGTATAATTATVADVPAIDFGAGDAAFLPIASALVQLVQQGRWPQVIGLVVVALVLVARRFGLSKRLAPSWQTVAAMVLAGLLSVGVSVYESAGLVAVLVNVGQSIILPVLTFLVRSDREASVTAATSVAAGPDA
jgi:hypothetical protein